MRTSYAQRDVEGFGDSRLYKRFDLLTVQLSNRLSCSLPQATISASSKKAMYRFLKNPQVSPEKMLAVQHTRFKGQLSERVHPEQAGLTAGDQSEFRDRFLQLSDTTTLDFTGKKGASSLGPLNYEKLSGLYLHNSLLLNEKGVPLNLLHQSYIKRSAEAFGKAAERKKLPLEQKESYRWKEHFLKGQALCELYDWLEMVYIADREADIMELYQSRSCERMHFVIRSKHNRKLADESDNLYEHLAKQKQTGVYSIEVVDPTTRKKRKAQIEVRFCKVELKLHKPLPGKRHLRSISLYAIEAKEINAPEEVENPIRWVLLTTLPVTSFEQAIQIIQYYIKRWLIERFHYLLKSGAAQVEELQLSTAERIKNAVTLYSIAVLNTFKMRYLAQFEPQTNIFEAGISGLEYELLYTYVARKLDKKVKYDPANPPNAKDFCITLAKLAGFRPSKRQPLPGLKLLAVAIDRLNALIDAYLILCQRTE